MRLPSLSVLILTLSACSLIPPLETPKPPVPPVFPQSDGVAEGAGVAGLPLAGLVRDPRLLRIVDLALENNRDLRLALLNVEEARSQYGVQDADTLPGVDTQASYSRERTPGSGGRSATVADQHGMTLGLNAFEIDLFGRVRALSAAALERYLASGEGYRAARLTLVGAVADAYFAERLAVEQRALAERTLADWRQSLELARDLRRSGQSGEGDMVQAEAQVALAEADLRSRERAVSQAGNALRLVVGTDLPADLPAALRLDEQPVTTRLPAGLPSDLLLNRPDIRQAERTLAAANADVGAARAAFFPRLSLTAAFGFASPTLGALFQSSHNAWNVSPRLVLPIFDGGRLDAELDLAKAREKEAVAHYEKAIQTAFREVADGLAGSATLDRQIEAQSRSVAGTARAVALAEARYRAGLEGRLALLDAQRQLQAGQQTLLSLRREEIANAVALYKALGGGSTDVRAPGMGGPVQ
ncbi:efflux transporter outer membrane subunit [Rhodospirillum rubrum]|uniref:RND efflux system, outer membrane lipoprotein, NodT n=1 Tax=Rhodospirillum rubrum (strain ATCC 11170 / ATH 1.1.1 / DSM 467 / LMG 4362 / NCIMB 8255 / S1) TaxID=269796 RepID=Q2RQ72_RHORT|nr:efflux transporter outer membrane subunit [Rhodospirillum rubrum]ABC23723.1 RND efflux system, outer membrane lipoprotein, NodT [Rhodospirillum rubrum ATCC 11170]AEO49462.1 RND efflux system, outer membrane lipoprotein, NodT [Rhodospirillum rubrum F11]MBK5955399.1 RND transporter [Rhodospirillum rubrum]QXG79679.1 efflux transporter outer membrane subunit [Rhodospirillum rubrum]HAP98919.1 RND transporter [Rhodospirillum rubrum]